MAFKPTKTSDLSEPQTKEEFVEIFGEKMVLQIERIFFDGLEQFHKGRSYFREADLVREAVKLSNKELKEQVKVLRSPHFEPLLQFIFRSQPWVPLDTRGTFTTQEMWDKEQNMLAMAGEEAPVHVIPEEVVDKALATRSWIDAKSLPADFVAKLKEKFPRANERSLENRLVVSAAADMGYECYGVDLTWNRKGASALSDDLIGSTKEFLGAIRTERENGGNWFVNPVVFMSDDWSTPDAVALKEAAKQSDHPVIFASRTGISDEQVRAVIVATRDVRRVAVIEGTAGAGKSFTMKSVCEAYMAMGYDVMGAALGWSAAKVLSGSTGLPEKSCKAMTGFLNSMRRAANARAEFFSRPTLIIVDEAGMVGTRYMHDLFEMTRRSKFDVKIVLTGDSLQVAPVDAGNALEAIIRFHGTTRIDTIRRQKQESHRIAVKRFSKRHSGEAMYPFLHQECVRWAADKEAMFNQVVQDFVSYRHAFPDKKALVLAYTNDDVNELNRRIRQVYKKAGLIEPEEVVMDVNDSRVSWRAAFSIGDEVVMRSNDQNLPTYYIPEPGKADVLDERTWEFKTTGVFNRNAGKIVGIRYSENPPGSVDFVVDLEGEDPARVIVNNKKFKSEKPGMPMVHNFATTIYASQGMTVNNVLMLDHEMLNFRLAYVGMSRHTEHVSIYLDETDLHLRLDKMMSKAPSRPVVGVKPEQIGVQTKRYSRAEMLQAVTLAWGKDSENLTATIFKERKMYGKVGAAEEPEKLAAVRMGDPSDPVTDFIAEINRPYPTVDIEKILQLPDPVAETEFVRPSDVEENRAAVSVHESPVLINSGSSELPTLPPVNDQEGDGIFSRAMGWVKALGMTPAPLLAKAPPLPSLSAAERAGHVKPADAFHSRDGRTAVVPAPAVGEPAKGVLKKAVDLFTRAKKRAPVELPMLETTGPVGRIDAQGVLRFDNVPQTLAPSDGSAIPAPSDAFLTSPYGKLWWAEGRHQEPRVLARNSRGEVIARYGLDGRCVVGEGFPPVVFAPKPSDETAIHIVPGVREWFLLQEVYRKKFQDMPEKMPHVIWGAKDVDWKHIAKGLQKRRVVIMRSKHDEGQLPWALAVEKELRERWGVHATIAPKPAEPVLEGGTEEPMVRRAAPGRRPRP